MAEAVQPFRIAQEVQPIPYAQTLNSPEQTLWVKASNNTLTMHTSVIIGCATYIGGVGDRYLDEIETTFTFEFRNAAAKAQAVMIFKILCRPKKAETALREYMLQNRAVPYNLLETNIGWIHSLFNAAVLAPFAFDLKEKAAATSEEKAAIFKQYCTEFGAKIYAHLIQEINAHIPEGYTASRAFSRWNLAIPGEKLSDAQKKQLEQDKIAFMHFQRRFDEGLI